MREYRVVRMKLLLVIASAVCLVYLFLAAYQENLDAEWRDHQKNYARVLATEANATGQSPRAYPVEMRQVYLEDWGVVDRCVTCHVGIDNPAMKDQPQPLTAHSGDWLKHHPPDRFGCTICHQGQGRATEKDAAHGRVPYWDEPLLTGDFVQATCAKCHREAEIPEAPVLNQGARLMDTLGCLGCHTVKSLAEPEKSGPRLTAIGSKVTRKWLAKWLANPRGYLPQAKMPQYSLRANAVSALSAYLMTFRDPVIDKMAEGEGDYDAGADVYRESQCIVCHVTKLDYAGKPLGGTIGPNLLKLGNKVQPNQKWLVAFFQNPHAFLPHTKMPRFHFSAKQAADLAAFAYEEWVDFDLQDAEDQEPEPPAGTPEQIATGKRLFQELGCAGCHDLTDADKRPDSPDLTYIGSTPPHQLSFGHAPIRHTLPDYLFTKLKKPRSLRHAFQLPPDTAPSETLWRALRPAALFSSAADLPEGTETDRLNWILRRAQQAGLLPGNTKLPEGRVAVRAKRLAQLLDDTGALNQLKMPDFQLSDKDAVALTIKLMSLSEASAPSKKFEVEPKPKVIFDPRDEFGRLVRRYRCTSCHKIRGGGELLASDLTWEGSRVQNQWLYHYLNKPYSMRRIITIAMPIFHFPDEETHLLADYMTQVLADTSIGAGWRENHEQADRAHGEKLFAEKGCLACHQVNQKGGDVGPSLTTQVPEFPVGTYVGDKLRPEWIYEWLKNPQALLPDTIEPNLGLSDQELLDLTAYLANLKSPDYQQKELQGDKPK